MLSLYLFSLFFGSFLLGVSVLFGSLADKDLDKDFDKDLDHDLDKAFDVDPDVDVEADVELDGDVEADAEGHGELVDALEDASQDVIWLPFLSMRFWTFGSATFGLIGLLMTLLGVVEPITGVVAGVASAGVGTLAAWFFKQLKKDRVSAGVGLAQYVGNEAVILLPVRPGGVGKIRIRTSAGSLEIPASTHDEHPIGVGERVIIAGVDGGVGDVSRLPSDSEEARKIKASIRAARRARRN